MKIQELNTKLEGFTGTEGYHYLNFLKNLKFTDGMKFLCEETGSFWLIDIVTSVQSLSNIIDNHFIIWRLEVKGTNGKISAYSDCESDGSYSINKQLYTQVIEYSDFPEGNFEFYQINDVVLLKSEY